MARILCFSEGELRRFTTAGVLIRTSASIGGRQRIVYNLEDNVTRYIHYLTQGATRAREGYQDEKRLTQEIVRQQKQLELAIARGDMIKRARVVFVMTNLLSSLRNHLLGSPARCARKVLGQRDVQKVRVILEQDMRNCMREVDSFGAHSFDESSKNGSHAERYERIQRRIKRRRQKG